MMRQWRTSARHQKTPKRISAFRIFRSLCFVFNCLPAFCHGRRLFHAFGAVRRPQFIILRFVMQQRRLSLPTFWPQIYRLRPRNALRDLASVALTMIVEILRVTEAIR